MTDTLDQANIKRPEYKSTFDKRKDIRDKDYDASEEVNQKSEYRGPIDKRYSK